MTTGILALIIVVAIILQIVIFSLISQFRREKQVEGLESSGKQASKTPVNLNNESLNHSITLIPSWDGFKEFTVKQRVLENVEQSICSFYLEPSDNKPLPTFQPGQYLTFKLSIPDPETHKLRNIIRCYSLSDSPENDHYRITVKRVKEPDDQPTLPPGLSSNFLHDHVHEDDRLLVKAPAGHFHLKEDESLPIVLIGGGIGITPMLSILNTLIEHNSPREIWLFYGVRNSYEQIMTVQLQLLAKDINNIHLHICYSRPLDIDREGIDYQHKGRVDIPLLRSTLKLARYQFYVCGPKTMMESIVPGLGDWGVDSKDIFYESFGPATLTQHKQSDSDQTESCEDNYLISFSQSVKQVNWDHTANSLLEFVEAQGIDVESGCRAGSCGSCQTPVEGEVEYSQQPDAEIKSGHCLLCISKPKSNITLSL